MSKKTLKDGLESLFGMPPASVEEETAFMGDKVLPAGKKSTKPSQRKSSQRKASDTRSRSGSSKSFTADLESLFQTVVKESVAEEKKKADREKKRTMGTSQTDMGATEKSRRPMSGLDALIRQTVEPNKEEIKRAAVPKEKKRVTFVFDKKKLLKLKTIAKLEKAYLKDIIGGLISEYLDEYDIDPEKISESSK